MSAEQSHSTSVLFTIKRKTNNKTDIIYGDSTENSFDNATESDLNVDDTKILCVIHKSGKIGAAYYSFIEQIVIFFNSKYNFNLMKKLLFRCIFMKKSLTLDHNLW